MVFPVRDRISTQKLVDWLKPQLSSGAKGFAGRVPDMPNRVWGLTLQAGPGLVMENTFEVISFQIVSRGGENNLADSEAIAFEIDDAILHCPDNFEIGSPGVDSVWCNEMGRSGGQPTQSPISDSESRWLFSCTYYAQVSI
jgi:hypothetical protein